MLDALIEAGKAPDDLADVLAKRLIPFHRNVAANCAGCSAGSVEATTSVVTENLDQMAPFVDVNLAREQFALVESSMRAFVRSEQPMFEQRVADGWIRDVMAMMCAVHLP